MFLGCASDILACERRISRYNYLEVGVEGEDSLMADWLADKLGNAVFGSSSRSSRSR